MLAPLEAERRAAGSRALVLLGAACVLSGLVAWGSAEQAPASIRAPALALYVPSAGLRRPMAVSGPRPAPLAPAFVLTPTHVPGSRISAVAPAAPVAPSFVMMPAAFGAEDVRYQTDRLIAEVIPAVEAFGD